MRTENRESPFEIPHLTEVERSEFYPVIRDAIATQGDIAAGHQVRCDFQKEGGYNGKVRISIDSGDWFRSHRSYDDWTRFPARIRAAATALRDAGYFGDFEITHQAGSLNIAEASATQSNPPARHNLTLGQTYTRADIYEAFDVPRELRGGNWATGYHCYDGEWFIFATVAVPGRTGHDYENFWKGEDFVWRGRTGSRIAHTSIQSLIRPGSTVHLFTREQDRSPFLYHGTVTPAETQDTVPVTVTWRVSSVALDEFLPDEEAADGTFLEGTIRQVTVNAYERNPAARRACVAHWGTSCAACGFDFGKRYGKHGEGFIHVHHLKPLASITKEYEVDPVNDLRPVCPNCHAMLHRGHLKSIEQLREILRENAAK